MSKIHHMAERGFGAGTNELYDRARPNFPASAMEKLYTSLPKRTETLNILEMGAGTGLFTRSLLSYPAFAEHTGSLIATDPSAGMRAVFTKKLAEDKRVSCQEGTFDKTGAPDKWADLIIAAQAWHWCPDHDKALTEVRRVLKPDGVFALIWNLEDRDAAAWVGQLRDCYEPYEQGTPQFRLGLWRATFTSETYLSYFTPQPAEEHVFTHTLPTTDDLVVDRVLSKSFIAVLEDEPKEKVKGNAREILKTGKGKTWIDAEKGEFEYPYKTYLLISRLKQ